MRSIKLFFDFFKLISIIKSYVNSLYVMPSCGVINCKNYNYAGESVDVSFFGIPKMTKDDGQLSPKLKMKNRQSLAWIRSLNRENIADNIRMCSEHFTNGYPAKEVDFKNEDWCPHINMGHDFEINIDDIFYLSEDVECEIGNKENVEPPSMNEVDEVQPNGFHCEIEHVTPEDQRQILIDLIHSASGDATVIQPSLDILRPSLDGLGLHVVVALLVDQNKKIISLQQQLEETLRNSQMNDDGFRNLNDLCLKQEDLISTLQSRIAKYEHQECAYANDDTRAKY